MSTYLITGASRGIGLEMVKQLLAFPKNEISLVIATSRSMPDELKSIVNSNPHRVLHCPMDVTDHTSIKEAAALVDKRLEGKPLDVLINNAAIIQFFNLEELDPLKLNETLHANVTAVHMVTQAFLPHLRRGSVRKVVNLTSTLGSMTWAEHFMRAPSTAYKISKAALNMLTVQYAEQYKEEGFTFVLISPGWLKTDGGGVDVADLDINIGVKATLDVIMKASKETSGQFRNIYAAGWEDKSPASRYDGKNPPW